MAKPAETYQRPSIFRHLAVIVYDLLLLLAVLLFATAIPVILNAVIYNGEVMQQGNPFLFVYLVATSYLFYAWFWMHGGQTLCMRSWQVYLISADDRSITWQTSFIRFALAFVSWLPLGLGFWWQFTGKDKVSLTDQLSATRLHYQQKKK